MAIKFALSSKFQKSLKLMKTPMETVVLQKNYIRVKFLRWNKKISYKQKIY